MISGVGNEAWILPWNARKHFMLSRWLIIEVAATCSCLQTEHDVDPSRSANFWKSDFALEIKSSLLLNSAKCFFSSFWNDVSSCGSRAVMGSIIPSLVPTSALTITSVSSERLLNNKDFTFEHWKMPRKNFETWLGISEKIPGGWMETEHEAIISANNVFSWMKVILAVMCTT